MTFQPSGTPAKYRVLFVRQKQIKSYTDFMNAIDDESVTALSFHFDLTVIDRDFDYGEICDVHNPDFVIFDAPGGHHPVPLTITNIKARPDIPRIGFSNHDPHDTSRVSFMRMMDEWGLERFFTICTAALSQSPEIKDLGFTLPLFFNPGIFKDYGLEKVIPFSVFGGFMGMQFYDWRTETALGIHRYIPTLLYTHPGYDPEIPPIRYPVSGEAYAKMLNRSHFSLADTTRLDYVVRKHLEIPACGAILVSPDTPEMALYGFKDMQNCVLGSKQALVDKLNMIAGDPDLYSAICRAGHDFVHSRYTMEKWTGIRDWYECRKSLKPGEAVQQQGFLGPFKAVPARQGLFGVGGEMHGNQFTALMNPLRDDILHGRNIDACEKTLHEIFNWILHMGEPVFMLGMISLLRGNPANARAMFETPQATRLKRDGATFYDPEEIAWLSFVGSLTGDKALLDLTRAEAQNMRHISLRRMKWLAQIMAGQADISAPPADVVAPAANDLRSMHWMGTVGLQDWLGFMDRVLAAHGIPGLPKT